MANSNTLTAVTPKLLAAGLMALRENAVSAQLVNRGYENLAGEKGSTIDVPVPSAIAATDVTPDKYAPDPDGVVPTSVPIAMTNWKEAAFFMSDKDILTAMDGTLPMQASEAIKALANAVDDSILALYKKVYGWHGTAGTTPFTGGTTFDATQVRKVLNNQLAPMDPRYVLFDADAEANALNLRAFQDMSFSGDPMAIIEGKIEKRLGFAWFMNQNIPTHTAGTAATATVNNVAGYSAGDTSIAIDGGSGTFVEGDVITFANHSQTYVVTADVADTSSGTMVVEPPLVTAVPDGNTITRKAAHVANLAFHRDAFALATRPLIAHGSELGVISRSAVDPVSGLTLRLEVKHEHKRLRYSYDILWGVACVRRELAARLVG